MEPQVHCLGSGRYVIRTAMAQKMLRLKTVHVLSLILYSAVIASSQTHADSSHCFDRMREISFGGVSPEMAHGYSCTLTQIAPYSWAPKQLCVGLDQKFRRVYLGSDQEITPWVFGKSTWRPIFGGTRKTVAKDAEGMLECGHFKNCEIVSTETNTSFDWDERGIRSISESRKYVCDDGFLSDAPLLDQLSRVRIDLNFNEGNASLVREIGASSGDGIYWVQRMNIRIHSREFFECTRAW